MRHAILVVLVSGMREFLRCRVSSKSWSVAAVIYSSLLVTGVASAQPANDNFSSAQHLSGNRGAVVNGTTVGATRETGEPAHVGNTSSGSVWYRWTAPGNGQVTVDTCASASFDTILAVYTGSSLSALSRIAQDDDACSNNRSSVSFQVTSGTTYLIAVAGFGIASGTYTLSWSWPANDFFAKAQQLIGNSGSLNASTAGATRETGEPAHVGNTTSGSVWYRWTAPGNGQVTVDTCASASFDTILAVYTGSSLSALSRIAQDDDACGNRSSVSFQVTSGTTYLIAVAGFGSASGTFTLSWSLGSACNYSISPASRTFTSSAGSGTITVTAGSGCAWTASSGASWITTSSTGSGNGTVNYSVAANTGTSQRTGTITVGGQTHSITQTEAEAPSPANDNFSTRQQLSGNSGSLNGTTVGATRETGEPAHVGNTSSGSVWYRWTAPGNGQVTVDTCAGASFDTILAVYTGSSLSTLSRIAQDDDACGTRSSVSFQVTSGTTYLIAVAGFGSASGTFTLSWSLGSACNYSISPASRTFTSSAGSGTITVTAGSGCAWTASSGASWITTSSTGSGNGTVNYSVAENTGTSQRTGTITVGAQSATGGPGTFTIVQSPASTLTVTPASRSVGAASGTTTFSVATAGAWAASSNQGWATVSPASGNGAGTVTLAYTANSGAARTATITVSASGATGSPTTVTVNQADGQCSRTLAAPTNVSAGAVPGVSGIQLNWQAVPTATGYRIFRTPAFQSTVGFEWAGQIATTSGTSFLDNTAIAGSFGGCFGCGDRLLGPAYTYWVQAVDDACGIAGPPSAGVRGNSWKEETGGNSADAGVLVTMILALVLASRFYQKRLRT